MEAAIREDIAADDLAPVLEAWWPSYPGWNLYDPSRAHQPRKLRVPIDLLRYQGGTRG